MGFQETFITFAMIGLFVFSTLAFIISVQTENNAVNKLSDDIYINNSFGNLQNDLNDFRDQAQAQKEVFEKDNPIASFGYLIFYSIISTGKVFTKMTFGLFNSLIDLPVRYLGVDPIVISILSTILIITIIIGLWIIYKVGG